jgi:hypothetical protein
MARRMALVTGASAGLVDSIAGLILYSSLYSLAACSGRHNVDSRKSRVGVSCPV